jgi:predicted secreted protein
LARARAAGSVGVRQKAHSKVNADLRSPTFMAEAEAETRIKQQQVSRWRTALRRPGYADRIFAAAHKKAMAARPQ